MSLCYFPQTLDCRRHSVNQTKAKATKIKFRPVSVPNEIHIAKARRNKMVHAANFGIKIEILKSSINPKILF